jgi:outer membrane protein OmpA-like peptidoglycan-associated protein
MLLTRTAFLCAALLLGAVSALGQQGDASRVLIYFDEFSANLTQEARTILGDVARRAREEKAKAVRIEARASATGSQLANRYLAMTRAQVVADELAKDGLDPGTLRQVVIGQTGSDDPSVADRRVDIVFEP